MPTVRLWFTPAAAHVRTVRLVGVAVARRAGVASEFFDEIRLAIGEACSQAVSRHQEHGIEKPVEVMLEDNGRFTVRVLDHVPIDSPLGRALDRPGELQDPVALIEAPDGAATGIDASSESGEEAVAVEMRLALLAGVVHDLAVRPIDGGTGTEVRMTWPVRHSGMGRVSGRAG